MKHDFIKVVSILAALTVPGIATAFDDGGTVIYQPFIDEEPAVTLRQFKGKYVELLLPDSWIYSTSNPTGLTDEERRILIDRADIAYQYYKEILQSEPIDPPGRNTIGLLRIAVVDNTRGNEAWANFGWKEMEITSLPARLQQFKSQIADGFETNRRVIIHEMGHNFDLYDPWDPARPEGGHHLYHYMWYENTCGGGTNWCHAWTNFWDGFLPYYGRVTGMRDPLLYPELELTADGHLDWWLGNSYLPYYENLSDPNVDWEECVRDSNCAPITARDSWAGIMFRYVQLYGVEAVLGAMDYLKDYVASNPEPMSKEEKEHLHIEMLAHGAQANLTCFLDEWQWYTSPALEFEMSVYGEADDNPFCKDMDADGFTPLQGDCNDSSNSVAPGKPELNNGVDDDCNGRVDDLLLVEPAGDFDDPQTIVLPRKIQAQISSATDSDTFVFDVSSPHAIDVTLTSPAGFSGAFVVYDVNGNVIDSHRVNAGQSARKIYELPDAREWAVAVVYDGGTVGSYELSIGEQPLLPLGSWAELSPPAKEGLDYRLNANTLTLAAPIVSESPTHIRFWVTGVGVVGTVPYTAEASVLWRPTLNEEAGTYGYRAQLMSGNKPVSDWTPIEWFDYIGPCSSNSDCDDGDMCTTEVCNLTFGLCSYNSLDGTYEAETMFHSTGNAYDEGWNVYDQNGYISFVHPTFIGGTQQMTVSAAGENGAGWPNMLVTVGGVPVFSTTVANTAWTDYTFPFPAPVGSAEVRIHFTNDFYQPPVDRNLLVDKAKVQCDAGTPGPAPINLGPVNSETRFSVSGVQELLIDALTFDWTPTQIVVGIGQTDNQVLNGISVSVDGGAPIALSGHWQQISIPYTGQSEIHLTVYSSTTRAIRTQWWAQ